MKPYRYLRNLVVIPPGGWRFTDPDTGLFIETSTYPGLLKKAKLHREYKQLSLKDLPEMVETQICKKLDRSWFQGQPRKP
jgi:hypothetical protein